jgi:hypothetical protein
MLLAEIHGKALEAARDNEDYLTSAVFGHLRYVPPGPFWDDLLKRAKGLPGEDGLEPSLGRVLADAGLPPSAYSRLEARFWRQHATHGEPDLILVFTAAGLRPLVVLIEAKLWAEKSGTGDRDQLVRYLRVLEDLAAVGIHVPADAARFLVYLTPGESLVEVADSAARVDDAARDLPRLFRLQWQDVVEAAGGAGPGSLEPARTILADVACFLRTLGLEYFRGMSRLHDLPLLDQGFGSFYTAGLTGFRGMTREPGLDFFEICKGAWA